MYNLHHHNCAPRSVFGFIQHRNVSGTGDLISVRVLRRYVHRRLGTGTSEHVTIRRPVGIIVSGCPRNGMRCFSLPGGPRGTSTNAHTIPFSHRVCVSTDSFTRMPPPGFFHLGPRNRMELVNTCVVGYARVIGSTSNGVTRVRTATSLRANGNGPISNEGVGNAVR